ncbi:MAG TPA: Trm112 family protein [Chromatiales bacterium]|nr:Trm112 family protein [Chromatiales bacterium]
MDKTLLDIICCPVSHLPLELLDEARLRTLNTAIEAGKVLNNSDAKVTEPLQEALISKDGRLVYPVRDGIPILLEDESISFSQVAS